MLVVHKFAPTWGLPDLSPFVVKLETWLRLAGIPYETRSGDPRKAPKGKIPYIVDDDGTTMGDSRFIAEHLARKHGVTLDAWLSPAQRAVATASQSMLEEHLYFVLVYERWQIDANWDRYRPVMGDILRGGGVPGLLVGVVVERIRKQMLEALRGQGTGRHEPAEVGRIADGIAEALATQIGAGPYFFGEKPASIDATAYAFVASLLVPPFEGPVREAAAKRPELRAYMDGVKARHW
jgi:glutathione S-transferase